MYKNKVICSAYDYCTVVGCFHKVPHIKTNRSCEWNCENTSSLFGGEHTYKECKDSMLLDVDDLFKDIDI